MCNRVICLSMVFTLQAVFDVLFSVFLTVRLEVPREHPREHSTDWGPAGMGAARAALFVPMGLRARSSDEQEVVDVYHLLSNLTEGTERCVPIRDVLERVRIIEVFLKETYENFVGT